MMTEPAANPTSAHQHANTLANLGLRVLPIRPGGKVPPFKSWQNAATNDPDKINNWYTGLYIKCGVGIALGPQPNSDNLFALDLDNHGDGDGADELADLEHAHGKLPDTWRSITGSGGAHLIFRAPTGVKIRNQQAAGNRLGPNIDVRGEGGQIVVAPTIHPETLAAYEWEHGFAPWEIPVADAPAWLLEQVAERPAPPQPATPREPDTGTVFDIHRQDWDWHTELIRHGWQHTVPQPNNTTDTFWTRPGKDPRAGNSAVLHGTEGPFVVFTTEMPTEWAQAASRTVDGSGWSFGPFGFYAATNHNGNRSAAAQALKTHYGMTDDLDGLVATQDDTGADPGESWGEPVEPFTLDWETFYNTDHKAEEWLWEPIIAAKRATAIYAVGGVGKSLIMLRMALDMIERGVRVLYLDYEMTPDDLADRLDDMHYYNPEGLENLRYALLPSIPAFDTPQGGIAVAHRANEEQADYVIIDTFARAVEGDENEADTIRNFYRHTGLALKQAGIGWARLAHAGKDASKGQRGSSAANDDVDVVWHLQRTESGYKLDAKKRRMGWVPETVALERQDDPFRLFTKGGPTYPPGTADAVKQLDDLGVPDDMGRPAMRKALEDAGVRINNRLLQAAIKYRKNRSNTHHFASDLVTTESEETARSVARSVELSTGAVSAAVSTPPETTKDQVDDLRSVVRSPAVSTSDATAVSSAPPIRGRTPASPERNVLADVFGDETPTTTEDQ